MIVCSHNNCICKKFHRHLNEINLQKLQKKNIKLFKSHKQLCPSYIPTREVYGTKQKSFTIYIKSQTPELFIEQHTLVSLPYHRFHPKSM